MSRDSEKENFEKKLAESQLDSLEPLSIPLTSVLSSFEYRYEDEQARSEKICQLLSRCSLDNDRAISFFVESMQKLELSNTTRESLKHLANIARLSESDKVICHRLELNPIVEEHSCSSEFHLREFQWLLESLAIRENTMRPLLTPAKITIWSVLFRLVDSLRSGEEDCDVSILLIVDRLDNVFSSLYQESLRLEILSDLVSIANDELAHAAVIVSGSTATLPRLIRGDRDELLLQKFPLLAFTSDVSCSKFTLHHIDEALATDDQLDAALSFFQKARDWLNLNFCQTILSLPLVFFRANCICCPHSTSSSGPPSHKGFRSCLVLFPPSDLLFSSLCGDSTLHNKTR